MILLKSYVRLLNTYRDKVAGASIVLAVISLALFYFFYSLGAVSPSSLESSVFEVKNGEGFRQIVAGLESGGFIKSSPMFKVLSVITGSAFKLKPGSYELNPSMSSFEILNDLMVGSRKEIIVVIPEGVNIQEIDAILSDSRITKTGDFISKALEEKLEGKLFPDTYKFFTNSEPQEIIDKFLANFELKMKNLPSGKIENNDLILASLLEKEVRTPEDQKIVAGILKKRIAIGIPLQVDATICYMKAVVALRESLSCYPLSPLDFKIKSDYNTYLYRGLPPGPIGNPGISAITSALNPAVSPYLFYLSDPETGKTVFAKTLEEQIKNKARYLKN